MFCIIEGANGCGKTTLINNLKAKGFDVLSSPNSTELARKLRPMARGADEWSNLDSFVKFLLFSAARFDEYLNHVQNKKELVISDRWWTSTYVYQCILEGIKVSSLEATIHPSEKIDFVVILRADIDIMLSRIKKEREKNPSHGVCTWIQDIEKLIKIKQIYENELKEYLTRRNVPVYFIDTGKMNETQVLDEFLKIKYFCQNNQNI